MLGLVHGICVYLYIAVGGSYCGLGTVGYTAVGACSLDTWASFQKWYNDMVAYMQQREKDEIICKQYTNMVGTEQMHSQAPQTILLDDQHRHIYIFYADIVEMITKYSINAIIT